MPFRPDRFLQRFEPLQRVRQRPLIGYATAIVAVAIATGFRLGESGVLYLAPFISFYPAVVLSVLVGGVLPGIVAAGLSAVVADYLFLPPAWAFSTGPSDLAALASFLLVTAVLITVVALLNHAVDRLSQQVETTHLILEAQPVGIIAVNDEGVIELVNVAVERYLGFDRNELIGKPVEVLMPTEMRAAHQTLRRAFMADPEPRPMGAVRDLYALCKDGTFLPVEIGLNPIEHNGRRGVLATVVDITERKDMQRAQVLSNEVRHRAGNLLMLVKAMARRTLPREHLEPFVATLEGLARVQDLVGTSTTAPLRSIVEGELAAFGEQAEVEGCGILLTPRAAQDFALIVHELATNATKYGALSARMGQVLVAGREEDGIFTFTWEERGGPEVMLPARRGFGYTIFHDVARSFATEVELDFPLSGFRYRISTEVAAISNVVDLAKAANRAGSSIPEKRAS